MALNQELDMKEDNTAFLTSDEMVIMSMINPKFKSKQDVNTEKHFADNQRAFVNEARKDPYLLKGTSLDSSPFEDISANAPRSGSGSGEPAEGGFAVAALLPLIPLIAPLIKPAIEGIASVLKRKGKGSVSPPNSRYGYGIFDEEEGYAGSVNPPNGGATDYVGRGFDIKAYLQSRLPTLQAKEEELRSVPGDQFWSTASKIMMQEVGNLVNIMRNEGVNIPNASRIVASFANKAIPKSFQARIGKGRRKTGGQSESQLGTIIKPMVKWSIYKSLDNKTSPQERKYITRGLGSIDSLIDGNQTGGRLTWEKIRATAKNVIARLLPKVAPILRQVAQQMIDRIPNLTASLLEQAGIESEGVKDIVGQAAKTIGKEATNAAFDSLDKISTTGKGPGRGTQAMKEKMAKLRAMRGKKKTPEQKAATDVVGRTTKSKSGGKKTSAYTIKLL